MKSEYSTYIKNLVLVFFFVSANFVLNANPVDSLIQVLETVSDGREKEVLYQLAFIYVNSIEDSNSLSVNKNIPFRLSDNDHIGLFYECAGDIYISKNQFDKAYMNLQRSINIYEDQDDKLGVARSKNALGLVYAKLSDFEASISYFMDAIRIFKENDDVRDEAESILNLGKVFQELDQLKDAQGLYLNALKIWERLADTLNLSEAYFQIAEIAIMQGKFDESLVIHERSVALKRAINFKEGLARSYFAIGSIHEQKDEFILAESFYQKALIIYKQLDDRYGMAQTLNVLGRYNLSIAEFGKARNYLNEAMIIADYINSGELLLEIYKNLSLLYEHEKLYDKAIQYYKNYTNLKDSLFSVKRYHKIAELKLSLDNQEKSEIIKKLEADSYFKSKALEKQQYLLLASSIAVVLFLLIVLITYKQSRRRKKSNWELKKQKEKAEEADRLKSAFLANMSHEIRSPMNAIIGFSDLIIDSYEITPEMEQYMGYIKQSGSNLIHLVDDIIDIAKIEAGQLKIRKDEFDLNEMMQKLLITVQTGFEKIKSTKASIHLTIPENSEMTCIVSDELRIKQVLTNFISNAVKFTEKGFIEFGYEILPQNQLLFYTKDSGLGISEHDKELVFQRFGQVEDSYTRNTSGTGLGLAISKSIIELLGGEIWFDSIEGKGTTFFFKIPVTYAKLKSKLAGPEQSAIKEHNWEDKVILVVEDDEMNFKVVSSLLRKTKAQLIRAENGLEAIQIARSNEHINLILMDIQMPSMNGYEASRKIKQEREIPIIAVTAYAMPGEKQKSFDAGCNGFITKPYNMNELISKMSVLIDL